MLWRRERSWPPRRIGLVGARPGANLAGSGVVQITNPGTTQFPLGNPTPFTFTATDAAGNSSQAVGMVTVVRATTSITAPNQVVQYGQPTVVTAALGAAFATGPVTFSFGPSNEYIVVGNVLGGFATASVPPVLLGVGTYPMQVSYPGDASVLAASTTASVTVQPAPVTVRADKTKSAGLADPVFTYQVTASACWAATRSRAVSRASGEADGVCEIPVRSLTLGPNTTCPLFLGRDHPQSTVTVVADHQTRCAASRSSLTFNFSPALPPDVSFTGALVPSRARHWQLPDRPGRPSAARLRSSTTRQLRHLQAPATVTAGDATKVFGTADPALAVSSSLPAAGSAGIGERRAGTRQDAGSAAPCPTATAAINNYELGRASGTFSRHSGAGDGQRGGLGSTWLGGPGLRSPIRLSPAWSPPTSMCRRCAALPATPPPATVRSMRWRGR
jgi:hypothetical protein